MTGFGSFHDSRLLHYLVIYR